MTEIAQLFITLGILLLVGLVLDVLASRIYLPRVTLFIVIGLVLGPSVLGLIPEASRDWFHQVTKIALIMIGFILGGKLSLSRMRKYGMHVVGVALGKVCGVFVLMSLGLLLVGVQLELALILAAIATATAPATTVDVIHETGAEGRFTDILLGAVALNDMLTLLIFSFVLSVAAMMTGESVSMLMLTHGLWETGGALILGVLLGVPLAFMTGRIKAGEPTLTEVVGCMLLCAGMAVWWKVSFILAAFAMGAFIVNTARHHNRPFYAVEGIDQPILILFFILAGAVLEIHALAALSVIGVVYLVLRTVGSLGGVWLGAISTRASTEVRKWIGMALLPQAGIALGLALIASERLPQFENVILPVVIGTTVFFELAGPVLTRLSLVKTGNVTAAPTTQTHESPAESESCT